MLLLRATWGRNEPARTNRSCSQTERPLRVPSAEKKNITAHIYFPLLEDDERSGLTTYLYTFNPEIQARTGEHIHLYLDKKLNSLQDGELQLPEPGAVRHGGPGQGGCGGDKPACGRQLRGAPAGGEPQPAGHRPAEEEV